ncbi:uncharacterized protein ARMOST_13924 [Armillaria ostoyae]|uniref:DUF6534 domain-containing protein n=1 Tax=Armillaria ostoyae TaxID=47428 RepID=A0A284RP59_ARMOS|nr:uncharacterized protein ARMOST_13924 [Armillaria ostoyae]
MSLAQGAVLATDPSAPPAFQDKLLGSLVVGSYVNAMLYILEIIQASSISTTRPLRTKLTLPFWQVIYFFNHYRRDRPLIKAGIIISLVMDTVCTISQFACVYLYCVTNWGDESYVFDQYWPIPTYLLSTGVTTAVVQSFLIYRFWSLTRQWIISGILGLGMLTSAAGLVATAAAQIMYPQYTERYKGRVYVTVWLIASAACDVCIAVSLTFQLRRMNPTFQESKRYPVKYFPLTPATNTVINRLIGSVISTGTASTIVAIVILIVFLKNPMTNVSTGVAFCLGRLYSLTMLYSLNKRNALRAEGSSGHSSGRQDRAVINAELFSTGVPLKDVHRTARIDISETGQERESSSHSAAFGVPAPKASYADTEAYPLHNLDTGVNKTVPENYQSGWAV